MSPVSVVGGVRQLPVGACGASARLELGGEAPRQVLVEVQDALGHQRSKVRAVFHQLTASSIWASSRS